MLRFFVVIGIILWVVIPNIVRISKGAVRSIYYVSRNWSLSYEEKMRSHWGPTYTYLMFVNDHTPSTAVIMRPPTQRPWLTIGNGALIRYFIYPRKRGGNGGPIQDSPYLTHILVARGQWNPPIIECMVGQSFPLM